MTQFSYVRRVLRYQSMRVMVDYSVFVPRENKPNEKMLRGDDKDREQDRIASLIA